MDKITYNKILNNEIDINYLSLNDMIDFISLASEEDQENNKKLKDLVSILSNQKQDLQNIKEQMIEETN